jgi:hypothetical protein
MKSKKVVGSMNIAAAVSLEKVTNLVALPEGDKGYIVKMINEYFKSLENTFEAFDEHLAPFAAQMRECGFISDFKGLYDLDQKIKKEERFWRFLESVAAGKRSITIEDGWVVSNGVVVCSHAKANQVLKMDLIDWLNRGGQTAGTAKTRKRVAAEKANAKAKAAKSGITHVQALETEYFGVCTNVDCTDSTIGHINAIEAEAAVFYATYVKGMRKVLNTFGMDVVWKKQDVNAVQEIGIKKYLEKFPAYQIMLSLPFYKGSSNPVQKVVLACQAHNVRFKDYVALFEALAAVKKAHTEKRAEVRAAWDEAKASESGFKNIQEISFSDGLKLCPVCGSEMYSYDTHTLRPHMGVSQATVRAENAQMAAEEVEEIVIDVLDINSDDIANAVLKGEDQGAEISIDEALANIDNVDLDVVDFDLDDFITNAVVDSDYDRVVDKTFIPKVMNDEGQWVERDLWGVAEDTHEDIFDLDVARKAHLRELHSNGLAYAYGRSNRYAAAMTGYGNALGFQPYGGVELKKEDLTEAKRFAEGMSLAFNGEQEAIEELKSDELHLMMDGAHYDSATSDVFADHFENLNPLYLGLVGAKPYLTFEEQREMNSRNDNVFKRIVTGAEENVKRRSQKFQETYAKAQALEDAKKVSKLMGDICKLLTMVKDKK